jgi:heme b synthase
MREFLPRLIAWETTRSCNLRCRHCRAAATGGQYPNELTTGQGRRLLDSIRTLGQSIVILTGGEPMLRADIYDLARYGTDLGLRMVMAPCGAMITPETAGRLRAAGIQRISLSIDGPDAATHDGLRNVPGAFEQALAAARVAREAGLPFQINSTISKLNFDRLPEILALAVALGAEAFHPFLLVPTGRGKEMADLELAPEEYERALHWIYEQRESTPLVFKPTCAPHYYRILRQRERAAGRAVRPETHGLDAMSKGCLGGLAFAFVSHVGKVQICGFLDEEAGDLAANGMDFAAIWRDSPLFAKMRDRRAYKGRCGVCEYHRVCGGCRARAFATTGDYLAEEPFCVYQPRAANEEAAHEI